MLYEVWEQKAGLKDNLIAQRLTWERAFEKKKENNNYYIVPQSINMKYQESTKS
jgi:hypothetical protein